MIKHVNPDTGFSIYEDDNSRAFTIVCDSSYGVSHSRNFLEVIHAFETGQLSTGTFFVASHFEKEKEVEVLDTGFPNRVAGICICDEQNAYEDKTENLYFSIGFLNAPDTEGENQEFQPNATSRIVDGYFNSFFGPRMKSYRVCDGKLFITPLYDQRDHVYFQKGHTYRWFAWPLPVIEEEDDAP